VELDSVDTLLLDAVGGSGARLERLEERFVVPLPSRLLAMMFCAYRASSPEVSPVSALSISLRSLSTVFLFRLPFGFPRLARTLYRQSWLLQCVRQRLSLWHSSIPLTLSDTWSTGSCPPSSGFWQHGSGHRRIEAFAWLQAAAGAGAAHLHPPGLLATWTNGMWGTSTHNTRVHSTQYGICRCPGGPARR
jgi:hypothetical protein